MKVLDNVKSMMEPDIGMLHDGLDNVMAMMELVIGMAMMIL
jgi:hypothetical protein